ncbi:hypothetical protein L596_027553 [Steinernema carpocapsae]|uniref:SXP/RAL-2 family protein Ani s 5-like cation-binding domain-containing protein n=1 Tax=Steinernema carpocapsae TaxID=34508 RepID=A0A4U5LVV5_STECR|nr:hypothetical protein L596_027553 [Steinernema carpocapsae]
MSIAPLLLWTLFVLTTAKPSWDFASSRSDQPPYPAWYQVPKSPLNYSPEAGYDRPATNYDRSSGYGRPSQTVYGAYGAARGMKNPPMEFGNERAIANNVLPGGRKPIAPFYGGAMGTPQMANMAQDPNAELFAAIKDVVSKFRASLDQSNVEQDVKKMGTQLENTWQELRRGSNGRLDHIFERAQQMLQDPSASRQ